MAVTATNPLPEEWSINDEVIRLRVWGTDQVFPLFADSREALTIGTASTCAIRVHDPARRASREHAHLQRIAGRWGVLDRGSKNGLYRDGAKTDKLALTPGIEVGIGGNVVLIAESARWIALRSALTRMLGWSDGQIAAVDRALRGIRFAAMRHAPLILCGERDLVPLAEELHRLTLPPGRPFVLCKPHHGPKQPPENATRWVTSGRAALTEAAGGTVCLLHKSLPEDLDDLLEALRKLECQTQLALCAARVRDVQPFAPFPVVVPPIAARRSEIERLILEYAADASSALGLGAHWLSPAERAWIRDHAGDSLPEIQRATLRLAAIREAGSVSAGASRIGISHTAMLKWLRSHRYPELSLLRASNLVPEERSS